MVALKAIDVKNNFKSICSQVFGGETVMLSRPKNQNVVMISEAEYNKLEKARRNLEYLMMLDESEKQLQEGRVVEKTMAELEAMAE
ncbi:MAG: type II toxin-antitoxin system Phd/YefM family antitoxin [Treponema sp.]|jgi:antitoxin YefM|nr:type II toxin-antitoxin system Phd/YefM family antitoxin [Treponema sp.]